MEPIQIGRGPRGAALQADASTPRRIPEPAPDRLARRLPLNPGKKGLIKVGYACNNHCTFCHTLDLRDIDGTGPLVMRKIDRARELGYGMVVLSGGEVTMRKELLLWAARTAAQGMDFGLVTNARMLAYPELVDKLMRLRLGYVYLSLHGGTARIHDAMVRAEAFDETYGAIRQLSGRNLDLTVNTVVTNTNLKHLRDVVDLMLPFPDLTLKFSMTQPKGGASIDHAFRALIPLVEECGAAVKDAIEYGQQRVAAQGSGPRFAHDGIPFCLLPGHERLYDDLRTHQFASMTEAFEPDYFPVDSGATVQPEASCGKCALRGPCPGLFSAYAELKGTGALRTVTAGTRSNSWSYAPERTIAKRPDGACPIHASPLPYDRGRTLFLDEGSRLVQYRTESRDFHDTETRHVKDVLGQLYLDVSDKPAPDDFARDLRKLRLAEGCVACDKRVACTGTWQVVDEDVFTPADAAVREAITRVITAVSGRAEGRGQVVDVGCSDDGRYADLWAPAVLAGTVRYLGVEPEEARAEALAERFPWAEVKAIPVEQLVAEREVPVGGLDALLVLRSWNHLRDPVAALGPLVAALRPGGMLLVVDNVAFGLLRSGAQRARAEGSSAIWEHYRNDDAPDAVATLAPLPLEVVRSQPITPGGSNQWLVELRRI